MTILGSHASLQQIVGVLSGHGNTADVKGCAAYIEKFRAPAFPKLRETVDVEAVLFASAVANAVNKGDVAAMYSRLEIAYF